MFVISSTLELNPSRPNHERKEKIKLNFYFNINFLNAKDEKG